MAAVTVQLSREFQDRALAPPWRMPRLIEKLLAVTLSGRAGLRLAQGRIPDAQRDCEAALEHVVWLMGEQAHKGSPENTQYLSLLGQILEEKSRIQVNQGQVSEGCKTLEEAVEKLSRAVEIDPSRVADKVKLDQIKARSAQSQR
jgi:tetratricopeptide (TPR) repeat protein